MTAEALNNSPVVEIGDDFDAPGEVTQVRKKAESVIDPSDYPARPDRVIHLDKTPVATLDREVEQQIDQWASQRMLKTQVVVSPDDERQDKIEAVLNKCQKNNKIHGFEEAHEDGKQVYTIYYRYNR